VVYRPVTAGQKENLMGKSLQDRLQAKTETWKPKPGDTLIGTLLEITERESEFGVYPLLIVETEDGDEIVFHAFHTVAKNELGRLAPSVGDQIGIIYGGKDEDRKYEKYRVVLDRVRSESKPVDWKGYADDTAGAAGTQVAAGPDEQVPPPTEEPGSDVDADVPF